MANNHPIVRILCAQCGASAVRHITNGKTPIYCGNACKVRAHKNRHPERWVEFRAKEREAYVPHPRKAKPKAERRCRCGGLVEKRKHLCLNCRKERELERSRDGRRKYKQRPWAKAAKRAERLRRKALHRGASVERFDPLEILARDGWCCHICGGNTPKRLRGTYDDRAPELDHIIPLAKGGQHTRLNTACACRKCNLAKADKPLGQLRLVA